MSREDRERALQANKRVFIQGRARQAAAVGPDQVGQINLPGLG
jgi:hypothetical protein